MNARYTSLELSRQLAAAGLEQSVPEMTLRMVYDRTEQLSERVGQPCPCADCNVDVRALNLHGIIEELTRERPGGRLASYVRTETTTWGRFTCAVDSYCRATGTLVTDGPSTVEAAGRALLALLRERKLSKTA